MKRMTSIMHMRTVILQESLLIVPEGIACGLACFWITRKWEVGLNEAKQSAAPHCSIGLIIHLFLILLKVLRKEQRVFIRDSARS